MNTDWRTQAACRGATHLWYAEQRIDAHAAINICRTCPAHWPCRNWWLNDLAHQEARHQYGIIATLTAHDRQQLIRAWRNIDPTIMRQRRALALAESWALRRTEVAA